MIFYASEATSSFFRLLFSASTRRLMTPLSPASSHDYWVPSQAGVKAAGFLLDVHGTCCKELRLLEWTELGHDFSRHQRGPNKCCVPRYA